MEVKELAHRGRPRKTSLKNLHRGDVKGRHGEELAQRGCARQTW